MTFETLFKEKTRQFEWLCNDYEELLHFMKELDFITRNRPFRVHNSIIWNMMSARRDKLFIDIVEWIDHIAIGEHNFLSTIEANHLKDLRIPSKRQEKKQPKPSFDTADGVSKIFHDNHIQYLMKDFFGPCNRLPRAHQTRLCPCDITLLKNKFKAIHVRLADARHMHAHPYDNITSSKNISLKDVGNAIEEIREYLGNLSSISNVGVALGSMVKLSEPPSDLIARDIVDQILCGSIGQIPFDKNPWTEDRKLRSGKIEKERSAFYDKLHSFYDNCLTNDPDYKKLFNDRETMFFQFSGMHKSIF